LTGEALENLFEPFYRVADVSEAGTGLGLSIAKKIIQRHGGVIHAANAKNGLEFFIRFSEQ
jgi:signal transduction histidine kinase